MSGDDCEYLFEHRGRVPTEFRERQHFPMISEDYREVEAKEQCCVACRGVFEAEECGNN